MDGSVLTHFSPLECSQELRIPSKLFRSHSMFKTEEMGRKIQLNSRMTISKTLTHGCTLALKH